jgi:hypothetical protein
MKLKTTLALTLMASLSTTALAATYDLTGPGDKEKPSYFEIDTFEGVAGAPVCGVERNGKIEKIRVDYSYNIPAVIVWSNEPYHSPLAGWFDADQEAMLKAFLLAREMGVEATWQVEDDCTISRIDF